MQECPATPPSKAPMGPPIASPAAAPANFPQIDIADPPNKYRLEHKDFYRVPHADNRLAGGRFRPLKISTGPVRNHGNWPGSRALARRSQAPRQAASRHGGSGRTSRRTAKG